MSESLEMYLKVIYTLTEQEERVHAIDIAKYICTYRNRVLVKHLPS